MQPPKRSIVKRHYQAAQSAGKARLVKRPWLLPFTGAVLGLILVAGIALTQADNPDLRPSDSHVVFIYSEGARQTVTSKAQTVGELVSRLNLNLSPQDVVEPSSDTPIVEDNFRINIYRARPVTVIDGGVKMVTLTAQKSPRMVAAQAGLTVHSEDIAKFEQGSVSENIIGEKVVVARATPILLNLYGAQLTAYTQAKTVAGLLAEKNIKLNDGESVLPDPNTPIAPQMQIFVLREGAKVETVEEVIPIPVQTVEDKSLSLGATAVRQTGSVGRKVVTYIVFEDLSRPRQLIQEVIVQSAVPKILAVGAARFSDTLESWLYKLRMCESHGNYQANTGNGYYGAYQFSASTWNSLHTEYANAHLAPPSVQDRAVITNTLRSSGGLATQHPGCYKKLGLSKFPPSNN
ncbi:hypothetical protein A3E49_03055 [Candidatus Saccharibacteria bacterium RIFCSPHIGHO2_12_FULL_49_19]|nr:MAG: hypothetical protein A2708_01220 [Candidatus Saccharibacteria bacterium RIFCSPHIGHO2_01_FULL_49_21]OGL37657.1 MAG: hypothetical protein A3E49_03055 [Candidatus Saccharibacteria bacterium RIFCSPHIGHO2_12_FULL_49_19]OGL38471.1 MAG: hypothetical protein A3B63_03100 [Candidatus Saccharibacteria bacterium RIFCSPLOWO2_01_FULL_49_22]